MTAFGDDLNRFVQFAERQTRDVFVHATEEVQRSVVEGSTLTGAPGQPVRTGALRASWIGEFLSETLWRLSTNMAYAEAIEDGGSERGRFNPARGAPRSEVGGYHSVAHTIAGWPRIVEFVTRPTQAAA